MHFRAPRSLVAQETSRLDTLPQTPARFMLDQSIAADEGTVDGLGTPESDLANPPARGWEDGDARGGPRLLPWTHASPGEARGDDRAPPALRGRDHAHPRSPPDVRESRCRQAHGAAGLRRDERPPRGPLPRDDYNLREGGVALERDRRRPLDLRRGPPRARIDREPRPPRQRGGGVWAPRPGGDRRGQGARETGRAVPEPRVPDRRGARSAAREDVPLRGVPQGGGVVSGPAHHRGRAEAGHRPRCAGDDAGRPGGGGRGRRHGPEHLAARYTGADDPRRAGDRARQGDGERGCGTPQGRARPEINRGERWTSSPRIRRGAAGR